MLNLVTWRIVLRPGSGWSARAIPDAIVTVGPAFRHPGLAVEVGLLLPNRNCLRRLAAALDAARDLFAGRAVGLFLADPFLNLRTELDRLTAAGITWIANLPSVEQQDEAFTRELADVGLDRGLESQRLVSFRSAGFRTLAVVADQAGTAGAVETGPDGLIVMPRIVDFAAGFPSFRQRGAAAAAVADRARAAGWSGPVLGLGTSSEADHETLWPPPLDGLICRPEPASTP